MLASNPIQYGWMANQGKAGYPSDVSDEEWAFVLPYLLLSRADSAHREHDLRAVFNGVRYIARTGNQWRFMPHGREKLRLGCPDSEDSCATTNGSTLPSKDSITSPSPAS